MKNCIFLLALAFASPTQAAILTTIANGYSVTGITGLVVNGETYDVTFSRYHSFDSNFGPGDPPPALPTFYFDADGAIAARDAIVAALNAGPVVPVEAGPIPSFSPAIVIPYRYGSDPENFFRNAGLYRDLDVPLPVPPPWRAGVYYYGPVLQRDLGALVFAEFVAVPEPASIAAWLGLLAAGASIYRRRRQQ